MPPELIIVIEGLGSGGAQRVVTRLCNAWAEQGRALCVVTLRGAQEDFFALDARVRREVIGGAGESRGALAGMLANLGRIRRLRRALRRCGAPVVMGFIGPTNVLVILAALGLGMRVVISERNDPARQSHGRIWDALRVLLYRRADLVTANSAGVLRAMQAYVPAQRLALLPNPVSVGPCRAREGERAPLLLAVGRLHRQKAYDVLLPAFAGALRAQPGWTLAIVGEGPEAAALRALARDLGVHEQVRWVGAIDDPCPWYLAAEVFVMASRHEGMPNALLEAMSAGLPAVVSDASPGPLEYVAEGVSGRVVPAEDPGALGAALADLMGAPVLRESYGRAARKRVAELAPERVLPVWERTLGLSVHAPAASP